MGRARQVLDAVHRYIDVPVGLDGIVDSPAVQRLRRVSQTALASMVYPSANGSRFEHALGAMNLAGKAFDHAWRNSSEHARERLRVLAANDIPGLLPQESSEAREIFSTAVAGVGLLHDIGHPPFSHALEEYFETNASSIFADTPTFRQDLRAKRAKPFHELAGEAMLDDLADLFDNRDRFTLLKMIYVADPDGEGWASALHAIVSGVVDIDRIDYLMRDSYHAGTEYGAIDASRLIASLEFRTTSANNIRLSLGLRARSAAELLLVQRMQAFRWMYFHPRVVAAEVLLRRALEELRRAAEWDNGSQSETDVAAVVRGLTPSLNYIKPSSSYHLAEPPTGQEGQPDPGTASDRAQSHLPFEVDVTDSSNGNYVRDMFSEIQMSVTDDTIVRYCSNAALYCYAGVNADSQTSGSARYLYYYGASLRRSSDLVILWKRHEEYAEVASKLYRHPIVESFVNRSREAGKRAAVGLSATARAEYLLHVDSLTSDPVRLLNCMGYRLLHRHTERLSDLLTSEYSRVYGHRGLWQLAFAPRRDPLHSMTPDVQLEGDSNVSVSLKSTSPLVASIAEVESRSIKLHAFFLLTSRREQVGGRAELRRHLRDAFVVGLPVFLKENLEDALFDMKSSLTRLAEFREALEGGNGDGKSTPNPDPRSV